MDASNLTLQEQGKSLLPTWTKHKIDIILTGIGIGVVLVSRKPTWIIGTAALLVCSTLAVWHGISETLAISQTLASQHLRLLRTARILRADREGRNVLYAIDDLHVREVLGNMVAHLTEPHEHRHDDAEGDAQWSTT